MIPTSLSRGPTGGLTVESHFSTFVAFMTVLEYGMENSPPACIIEVAELRQALEDVEKSVRTPPSEGSRTARQRHERRTRGSYVHA